MKTNIKRVVAGIVLMYSFSLSCKKDEVTTNQQAPASQQAPVVTLFSPAEAYSGDTIFISGQNFIGVYNVKFGEKPAAGFVVLSPTRLRAVVPYGIEGLINVNLLNTAGKGSGAGFNGLGRRPENLQPIQGYYSSDEVAKSNLIAYWGFNQDPLSSTPSLDAREHFSGIGPVKKVNAQLYDGGIIGKAAYLYDGYLIYPPIEALNKMDALTSYTVSMWVSMGNSTLSPYFLLAGTGFPDLKGQIQISGKAVAQDFWWDSLLVNSSQAVKTSTGIISDGWNLDNVNHFIEYDNWAHMTVTYDGPVRKLCVYVDGQLLGTKITAVVTDPAIFNLETPNQVVFGTYAFREDGFLNSVSTTSYPETKHGITGIIDEVRIFNTALTETQISALTQLGRLQR